MMVDGQENEGDAAPMAERMAAFKARQASRARALGARVDQDALARQALVDTQRHAARMLIADASVKVGDEAIGLIVLPLIERVQRGDIDMVDLAATHEVGVTKALRTNGLSYALRRLELEPEAVSAGMRFARCIESARIGRLTANLEGGGGSGAHVAEPERWLEAMGELRLASFGVWSDPISRDERVVLFGVLACDVSLADLGRYVACEVAPSKNQQVFTGKLLLTKGLNKLKKFYAAWDVLGEEAEIMVNRA